MQNERLARAEPADCWTCRRKSLSDYLDRANDDPARPRVFGNCAILSRDLHKVARVHNLLADCNKTFPAHSLIENAVRSGRAPQDAIFNNI
jgi:hypothetical protein